MASIDEKIKKIEALIERASTNGEKQAAIEAKSRLLKKVNVEVKEFSLYTQDMWHKKLLLAICRKHNLKPYRYNRQKYTTVMLRVNEDFLNDVVWREYLDFSKVLEELVDEIMVDVISKIHKDEGELIVRHQIGS